MKTIAGTGFPGSLHLVSPKAKKADSKPVKGHVEKADSKAVTVLPIISSPYSTPSKAPVGDTSSGLSGHMSGHTIDVATLGNKTSRHGWGLNLEEKLRLAVVEAEAEATRENLDYRVKKVDRMKRKESLLLHADDVLRSGMRTLQHVKQHQTAILPRSAPLIPSKSAVSSTSSDVFTPEGGVRRNQRGKKKEETPLQLFLEDPAVRDIEAFRKVIHSCTYDPVTGEPNDIGDDTPVDAEGEKMRVSAAWRKNENPKGFGEATQRKQRWNDGVSAEAAARYTQSMLDYQSQKKEVQLEKAQLLVFELQRDIQLAANRKAREVSDEKEGKKREIRECLEFAAKFNEEKKARAIEKRRDEKLERKKAQAARAQARQFAEDTKAAAKHQTELADKAYKESLLLEKERLKQIVMRPDADLKKRTENEEKARILEEEEKIIRAQLAKDKLKKAKEFEALQKKTREAIDQVTGRLRMGNFEWHGGVLGFYNDIRAAAVPWIEFIDPYEVPLYYDPISKRR